MIEAYKANKGSGEYGLLNHAGWGSKASKAEARPAIEPFYNKRDLDFVWF